ncbi:MAG: hypothetical protein F6J93_35495 [Oscillatoria sp. SIO1A7]|nr:hypothetical protein [Oscillatoria sp. SIO1A7]
MLHPRPTDLRCTTNIRGSPLLTGPGFDEGIVKETGFLIYGIETAKEYIFALHQDRNINKTLT